MDANTLTRRFRRRLLLAAAIGAGGFVPVAVAQRPSAATLLPARPVEAPVVRGSTPDPTYQFSAPASVPVPGTVRPPVQVQPQAQAVEPVTPKPGFIENTFNGVKNLFGGKSADAPTGELTMPAVPPPQPPQSATDVYAGPPAYRWYGYGSTTPGANPFAPNGLYPKGSANWYNQTGATPGAFPVPVTAAPHGSGAEPPGYVGHPLPQPTAVYTVGSRPAAGEPVSSQPPRSAPVYDPRSFQRLATEEPLPQMPGGMPSPVAATAPLVESNWQSAGARTPIAATAPAHPPAAPLPVPIPLQPEVDWAPARTTMPSAPTPTVSVTRGQVADESADVEQAIRAACFGRTSSIEVKRFAGQRLVVRLTAPSEPDARDAMAVISRIPELKTYAITFEAAVAR